MDNLNLKTYQKNNYQTLINNYQQMNLFYSKKTGNWFEMTINFKVNLNKCRSIEIYNYQTLIKHKRNNYQALIK